MLGIRNPSSADKESGTQFLESGIITAWNPESKSVLDGLTYGNMKLTLKLMPLILVL